MYCGKCNAYIPDNPGIKACFDCGTDIQRAIEIRNDLKKKELEEVQRDEAERVRSDRRYNYLDGLLHSFFSKYFYRDVFRRWTGMGMLYLAFVTALGLTPYLVGLQHHFSKQMVENLIPTIKQIPRITFAGGTMTFEGENPYAIRNPKNNEIYVLLNRSSNASDLSGAPVWVLVTSNKIMLRENVGSFRTFEIPEKLRFVVTPQITLYWVHQLERWFLYLSYPLLWGVFWVYIMVVTLLYSLGTKLLAFLLKVPADFQTLFRLTVIALTPVMITDGIVSLWDPIGGIPDWITFPSPLIFAALGLWYNRESSRDETRVPA